MSIIAFQRGDKTALTKNFTKSEFECPCGCGQQSVDMELAEKLREPERHAPENWLIVTDRFTSRRFRLEELKSITLIVDGQAQELLPKQKGVHQK